MDHTYPVCTKGTDTPTEPEPCERCGHFHPDDDGPCPDPSEPCGDYRCCIN